MPLPPPHADTQYIDERNGLVFPWFTKPFLDVLKTWYLKDKRVFEYGGGHSTIWWGKHAKQSYVVECDQRWFNNIVESAIEQFEFTVQGAMSADPKGSIRVVMNNPDTLLEVMYRPVHPGEVELKSDYVTAIYEIPGEFDIIVIDGSYRDECIVAALTKIKAGGIIICDNWDQEGVWDSIMGGRLLDPWPAHLFVEPARAQDVRPWKTGYWQIYKCMQSKINDVNYPASFFCVDDAYNSHRPMLWMALEHIKPGTVVELGAGFGSTPLLERYCKLQNRLFFSFERKEEWLDNMGDLTGRVTSYWSDPVNAVMEQDASILFIDSAPGEERAELLRHHANNATVLIVHDTEPSAENVYHIQDALNSFKYRCDLLIDGYPQTTAVSNTYDFDRWKGVTLGKFKFV